ncbi:hypothetical protein B0T26DRAFT_430440 [Lasiosphaeria miniovina]|uniref:Uncharacterized protein n=1 Tax=Lasiosphaeria miniovina TaxID=1954250 RepID=A0AA40A645_9PEZI|nr:uncharacterized protein B0T26DRAFT_430440 [Lasiosphaeria miniovina]KAK0710006.1 hypothetical protein B0T26DRAFT_430440 [Lasiosphaeria miniovina]
MANTSDYQRFFMAGNEQNDTQEPPSFTKPIDYQYYEASNIEAPYNGSIDPRCVLVKGPCYRHPGQLELAHLQSGALPSHNVSYGNASEMMADSMQPGYITSGPWVSGSIAQPFLAVPAPQAVGTGMNDIVYLAQPLGHEDCVVDLNALGSPFDPTIPTRENSGQSYSTGFTGSNPPTPGFIPPHGPPSPITQWPMTSLAQSGDNYFFQSGGGQYRAAGFGGVYGQFL